MTKSKILSPSKPLKKKPTKEDLEKLIPAEVSEELDRPKKRLRKHRKHDSSDEDFIPND
jgi:hypothetical protein